MLPAKRPADIKNPNRKRNPAPRYALMVSWVFSPLAGSSLPAALSLSAICSPPT